MSFEASKINGVTKQQNGDEYYYFFPICTFQAFYNADPAEQYFFQTIRGERIKVRFLDIINNLGAVNVVEYLDKAAENGLYFAFVATGTSAEATEVELSDQSSLFFIAEQLQQITFYLKSIAE